ncbi:Evolutionarily Conserved Signaling Intermediate In Toll Pathway [Manis pentadactyla]|nr:Evolutionarily Conserved Signaling Intermediate In Toll Pathway [Manis pentadactyla]
MLMVAETLELRKELGSGSDVTGSARCWIRVMVKCQILTKGLGLALVTLKLMVSAQDYSEARLITKVMVEFQETGNVYAYDTFTERIFVQFPCEYECEIEALETLELRKELGSGSDVTGVQDVGSGLWVRVSCNGMSTHMIRSRREFLFNSDDYSEARLITKVMVEFQETVGINVKGKESSPGIGPRVIVSWPRIQC